MADYEITQNDTAEFIEMTLFVKGAPYDLTGAKSIELHMEEAAGTKVLGIELEATGDPKDGEVRHQWETPELALDGTYKFEVEVVDAANRIVSFPSTGNKYELVVNPEIG